MNRLTREIEQVHARCGFCKGNQSVCYNSSARSAGERDCLLGLMRDLALQSLSQEAVRDEVLEEIMDEVQRATSKFPTWPTDPLHAVSVLGEEFGELTKAILQLTYEPNKTSTEEVRKEALQTAAMAYRLYASLDRYDYKQGPQHEQAALKREPNAAESGASDD